jgi:hypothetical protein
MRIGMTGATGNIGTAVRTALEPLEPGSVRGRMHEVATGMGARGV